MAKWNLDTIEADMAEIRESVDKLQEINRLQAGTIERQAEKISDLRQAYLIAQGRAAGNLADAEALREQLRQAQQSLRHARDAALEDAVAAIGAGIVNNYHEYNTARSGYQNALRDAQRIVRSLKSTTQGCR